MTANPLADARPREPIRFVDLGKRVAKRILRLRGLAVFYAYWLERQLTAAAGSTREADDVTRILMFSPNRGVQDRDILCRSGRAVIYPISFESVGFINSLFVSSLSSIEWDSYNYMSDNPEVVRRRNVHVAFLATIMRRLKQRLNLNVATSPAAHYRRERLWADACRQADLPFIAIHKEMTLVEERHVAERARRKRRRGQTWNGSAVIVANERARRIAVEANLVPEDRVVVGGLLRSDDLIGPRARPVHVLDKAKPVVTLFSFGHLTGAFLEIGGMRSPYFSEGDREGYVRLFDSVHGAVAKFAIENPNVTVYVKPKNFENDWLGEIDRAVFGETGMRTSEIENLRLENIPAVDLIDRSLGVVALNSTVVLESRLRNKPVIMPFYHEAAGSARDAVYMDDFFDLFHLAKNRTELSSLLAGIVDGSIEPCGSQARLDEATQRYFGFADGRCADRILDLFMSQWAKTGLAEIIADKRADEVD